MFIDKYGALKVAKTLAQHSGLQLVLEGTSSPRTDGRTIYVELPKDWWSRAQWSIWWGHLYHEIGHNAPEMRDCFTLIKEEKIDMSSFLGIGLNIIEDNRQERHNWGELHGRRKALSRSQIIICKMIIQHERLGQPKIDKYRQAIEAVLIWDTWERQQWMSGMGGLWEAMYKQVNPQTRQWVDALQASRFVLKDMMTDARSVYDLWKEIIDEIFKFDSEAEEKKAKGGGGKDKGSGDKEGDGTPETGEEGEGADASDSDGNGSDEVEGVSSTMKYEDLLKHLHEPEKEHGKTYQDSTITYDSSKYVGGWNATLPRVTDWTKQKSDGSTTAYRSQITDAVTSGKGLTSTVRRLLQIRSRDRWQYGKKKGKLHGASLHRLSIGGSVGERVFRQKRTNECLDVSFTVLGDASGSMGGAKYPAMCASMLMLRDAVQPLGVPFELLTFTDTDKSVINVLKTFKGKVGHEELKDRLCQSSNLMRNNADGECIMWAYSRLLEQRTKRKVLVVLSDGQPATRRGDAASHTLKVIQEIEKEGKVEIYGVGIMSKSVSNFYKDHQFIHSTQELEGALLDIIKNRIIK